MKMKKLSVFLILLLALVFSLNITWAREYPTKPVTLLIPFGAGGAVPALRASGVFGEEVLFCGRREN